MAKNALSCRHITSLNHQKIVTAPEITIKGDTEGGGDSEDAWLCMTCFRQWGEQGAFLTHGRTRTHPLAWSSKDDGFYCLHCKKIINESMVSERQKELLANCTSAIKSLTSKGAVRKDLSNFSSNIHLIQTNNDNQRSSSTFSSKPSKEVNARRPFGLHNLGNTCFMNSALQSLTSLSHFTNQLELRFNNSSSEVPNSAFPISFALRDLLMTLLSSLNDDYSSLCSKETNKRNNRRSNGNAINPSLFFDKLSEKYDFLGRYDQQDSHDFLRLLFNAMDDEFEDAKKRELIDWDCSPHSTAFGSIISVRVVCHRCKVRSTKKDPSLDLSLAISHYKNENNEVDTLTDEVGNLNIKDSQKEDTKLFNEKISSISSLIQNWMRPQELEGENKFACENCYKKFPNENENKENNSSRVIYSPATCRYTISHPPKCLLIHLQRFSLHRTSVTRRRIRMTYGKDHSPVKLIKSITLFDTVYTLRSFVCHEGSSAESGHYVAIVYRNGSWFFISDSSVSQIEEETALSYENAYMAFYEESSSIVPNI